MKKVFRIAMILTMLVIAIGVLAVQAQAPIPAPPVPASAPASFDWGSIWPLVSSAGLPGLLVALVVLVFVFLGDMTDVFPNGTFKRIAAIVASFLFAGAQGGQLLNVMTAAIAIVASTLLKMLLDKLIGLANVPATFKTALKPPTK